MVRLCVLLVACSSPAAPAPTEGAPKQSPVVDNRRWIPGDVHMHVTPPDGDDVLLTVAGIAKASRGIGMEFVVLTPHLWHSLRGLEFNKTWRAMAFEARSTRGITLIPGIEWTTRQGHFTIAGVDVTSLGTDILKSAHQRGAFISVNHPFAVPTKIPGIGASHYDLSYPAWSRGAKAESEKWIGGVEVWNFPLGFANVISKPGGKSGEHRAWDKADHIARTQRRKLTAVGGTDNHHHNILATTWVLAEHATEAAVLDALRAGATCVGGPEAGSLRAKGDGAWLRIGGIARGDRVELAWDGTARLIVDGVDRGEHPGRFVHATGGVPHTYRIVVGASRCGFVYANL